MRSPTSKPGLASRLKRLSVPCAALALATGAMSAFGAAPTLSEVPPLGSDASNEGRSITRDGKYVVGLSGTTSGFLFPVGSASSIYVLSSDGAGAEIANGVGYRTVLDPINPPATRTELLISGKAAGYVTEWMTPDGGTTFAAKRRNTSFAYNNQGVANQLGASLGSDAYYVTSYQNIAGYPVYLDQGAGAWVAAITYTSKGITAPDKSAMNGVGPTGRAVGWRGASASTGKNYMLTYNGTGTPANSFFNGLAGDQYGQAFAVSADGNVIVGQSAAITNWGGSRYAYRAAFTGVNGTNGTTLAAVNALPLLGDETGSVSLQVAYSCSADGKYAVGMGYRGMERAMVWDASASDTNKWTATDLTDLARNNGFIGDFTYNLRRAYGVATNGAGDIVVTGYGVLSSVSVRAFVMTVPRWIAAVQFPPNKTLTLGGGTTFSLKTNGTDSLTYQWYKNGTVISGATGTSMSFTNVSCASGDAGTYQIVVNNAPISGVVTGAFVLTVLDPAITTQPVSHVAVVGSNTTFTVAATGTPTLAYQWLRGGSPLSDGDTGWGSTIAGASTPSLTISNTAQLDGLVGEYTVTVTTSSGGCSTTSRAATLTVLGLPVLSTYVTPPSGGYYTLSFSGPGGQTYKILYSTNAALPVASWKPMFTNTFSGWDETYTDVTATNSQKYYILTSP
ncbi:MAG: immunoglobulin domain-containing protein [Verrucomicrobiota bacterium]